eukprot:3256426-Heterocapsa_arctica.AAC.1
MVSTGLLTKARTAGTQRSELRGEGNGKEGGDLRRSRAGRQPLPAAGCQPGLARAAGDGKGRCV